MVICTSNIKLNRGEKNFPLRTKQQQGCLSSLATPVQRNDENPSICNKAIKINKKDSGHKQIKQTDSRQYDYLCRKSKIIHIKALRTNKRV